MIRFKQYLPEKRDKLMVQRMPKMPVGLQDGLRNPSPGELEGFLNKTKTKEVRFIITSDGDLLAWDAIGAIHAHVAAGELGATLTTSGYNSGDVKYASGIMYADNRDDDIIKVEFFPPKDVSWAKKSRSMKNIIKKFELG